MTANMTTEFGFPGWLPDAVRLYLDHTAAGVSLRALARREGCHASTILRQVRRTENRRDDPLMDAALAALGRTHAPRALKQKDMDEMTMAFRPEDPEEDETQLAREAKRVLRRLAEPGAVLAVAPDMDRAAVLRDFSDGRTVRTAVVDRAVAQAFTVKDWIACRKTGRVATYEITPAGRAALKRFLAAEGAGPDGPAEGAAPFADQHRDWSEREVTEGEGRRKMRYNAAESPVSALSRRREKDGTPFLTPDLVQAAERLREDFELAQMGPRVAQNWDRFLTAGDRGLRMGSGPADGPRAARERVAAALRDLGPGLGDVALRCCCFLEGLEAAEQRMGWSARSGKIVLRIALMRLKRHYEETGGLSGPLIG
ncbi:MAG: helix-turn-helix domain-containing protein [Paracoccaceae bacterium]|nr:helix-turn-helix domain-containing protein [Paracoccaceae bacterium]